MRNRPPAAPTETAVALPLPQVSHDPVTTTASVGRDALTTLARALARQAAGEILLARLPAEGAERPG